MDSLPWIPNSILFVEHGLGIQYSLSCIPDSKAQDTGFRIPACLREAKLLKYGDSDPGYSKGFFQFIMKATHYGAKATTTLTTTTTSTSKNNCFYAQRNRSARASRLFLKKLNHWIMQRSRALIGLAIMVYES